MSERPLARRGALVGPSLLLFFLQAAACGGQAADPVAALRRGFPDQASAVTGAGQGFSSGVTGFAGDPSARIHVELPWEAGGAVLIRGPRGLAVRVREIGAAGEGRPVDRSVTYRRDGGASYWTTTAGGVEEWVQVDAAHAKGGSSPIAAWEVEGAGVRARGEVVELIGSDGAARVRVTAPEAYAEGGRRIEAHLRAAPPAGGDAGGAGGRIELFADGGGDAVLVDPRWKVVAPMSAPRYDHHAALVGSGKVLVSGGTDGQTPSLDTAALYDPAADAWQDVGPMVSPHVCHTETALVDGTVLVAGGIDDQGNTEYAAEVYDETKGWTGVAPMFYPRMNHAAARMLDGRVLVTGGVGPPLAAARKSPSPQIIPISLSCWTYSGGLGGSGGPGAGGAMSAAEIYDPALGGWTQAAWMWQSRDRHTETVLQDGTVMVTGGENGGWVSSTFEIYDPAQDAWNWNETSLATPRADHTATLLPDGTVLLVGGTDGSSILDSAEILAPTVNQSGVLVQAHMSTPRAHHTASLLPDGTVLVVGGTDGTSSLATAEIFDPVSQQWTMAPDMAVARSEHAATPLQDGDVMVMGGLDETSTPVTDAEIYTKLQPQGAPCKTGGECQSSFCTQGVCCDSACGDTQCQACAAAQGATGDGVCTPLDGVVCEASPCKVAGICLAGACTGAVPKACVPADECHEPGVCEPATGACTTVAKLDGSPCSAGICVAGVCIPDPSLSTSASSSSSSGTTTATMATTPGTTTTAPGSGGAAATDAIDGAQLSGNGCAVGEGGGAPRGAAPAGILLGLLAVRRRRRARGRR